MKRMACVLALATGTGLALGTAARPTLAAPAPAETANGLQVSIMTPKATSGDTTLNLDVKFRGANLRAIELYVDGTLIKKQSLRTRNGHGTIRFALDSSLLTNGQHEVRVVATDVDGNAAEATTQWNLVFSELNSPVSFLYPKSHDMIQGVVPIEVKVDDSLHKPYVVFIVDNDFLAFINFPPFTYNWDSTHVANGPHTLGVEVYDGETLAKIKAHSMQVMVNNPGGLTMRQQTPPDLSKPTHPTPGVPKLPPAELGAPAVALGVKNEGAGLLRQPAEPLNPFTFFLNRQPSGTYSTRSMPHIGDIHHTLNTTHPALPVMTPRATSPGLMALLAGPRDLAALNIATVAPLAHQSVRPLRAGNIAARPSQSLGAVLPAMPNAHGKVVAPGNSTARAQVGSGSLRSLRAGTFDVAFDDTRIAFDVPPRVEHGLPLAPFRQIFEHTGGKVAWYGKSKLVRAVNATREIEIKIGNPEAKVNNEPLKMDAKPYIDRGRTIVPLSFVRDALNVYVQYDPQTGRMLIESKK